MLIQLSERAVRWVQRGLAILWLTLISSLLFDPLSAALTTPDQHWSPFRINPTQCIYVQNHCVTQTPYEIGAALFWGMIIPAIIFVLIFGHELWRRICPLSFFSQLPRTLGLQRKTNSGHRTPRGIPKIPPNSWLGRNYHILQFSLLFLGLCGRILVYNADRHALATLFVGVILAAIVIGYLYAGKSWCQYICPMATVQRIFCQPIGLFTQLNRRSPIPQSMCRTMTSNGKERSTCVACQSACMDIDAMKSYWTQLPTPQFQFIYYGYAGLVTGYFLDYYLYAGSWSYYFSGIWAQETDQLQELLNPGFFLWGHAIGIPKLLAVPLTLGVFSLLGYVIGRSLEQRYHHFLQRRHNVSPLLARHRMFSLVTVAIWNLFFAFGGRPFILLLPIPVQVLYTLLLLGLSTVWLYRVWPLSPNNTGVHNPSRVLEPV